MEFTFSFLAVLGGLITAISPLLFTLVGAIALLAGVIAKREGWPFSQGLYFGFITATTVGYGDMHPTRPLTRFLAVVIAFLGLTMTGIVVALAVEAMGYAYDETSEAQLGRNLAEEPALLSRVMGTKP